MRLRSYQRSHFRCAIHAGGNPPSHFSYDVLTFSPYIAREGLAGEKMRRAPPHVRNEPPHPPVPICGRSGTAEQRSALRPGPACGARRESPRVVGPGAVCGLQWPLQLQLVRPCEIRMWPSAAPRMRCPHL
jgi:hypothetical protein